MAARVQGSDRHKDRGRDPELLRDRKAALGDVDGRRHPKLCGVVRVPGESFNRMLYQLPDGLHVAGAPCYPINSNAD